MSLHRKVSDSEELARQYMKVKNDRDMKKLFGDKTSFPGVVAVLKTEFNPTKTKFPYKTLRDCIFSYDYITTHVLSHTAKGGTMV